MSRRTHGGETRTASRTSATPPLSPPSSSTPGLYGNPPSSVQGDSTVMDHKFASERRVSSTAAGKDISEEELEKDGKSKSRISMTAPTRRHRRGQNSGGFLLESVFPASSSVSGSLSSSTKAKPRESTTLQSDSTRTSTSPGRHNVRDEAISVPKRSSLHRPWHRRDKSSLGSSPLAKAPTNANTISSSGEAMPANRANGELKHQVASPSAAPLPSTEAASPAVGFDTDPAQIVNLALNLSESRRRSYGGSRIHSGTLPGVGSRTVSRSPMIGYHPGSPQPQRQPGWANPTGFGLQQSAAPYPFRASVPASKPEFSSISSLNAGSMDDHEQIYYDFSEATLLRADKARRHFELFWEYLRLLPHLSPLRPSSSSSYNSPPSSADGSKGLSHSQRAYNPLQLIRNRKVRFREKSPIDIESEGWEDLAKVHQWLDTIESNRSQGFLSSKADGSLPQFNAHANGHRKSIGVNKEDFAYSPSPSGKRNTDTAGKKPARQRIDWTFSPAELLADAAWVEEGGNKSKIVDRDGNRLFPNWKAIDRGSGPVRPHMARPDEATNLTDRPATPGNTLLSEETSSRAVGGDTKDDLRLKDTSHLKPRNTRNTKPSRRERRLSSSPSDSMSDSDPRGRSRKPNWEEDTRSVEAEARPTKPLRPRLPGLVTPERLTKQSGQLSAHNTPLSPSRSPLATGRKLFHDLKTEITKRPTSPTSEDGHLSLEELDSTAPNSPVQGPIFPSITVNLSPPSSRETSPPRAHLPRVIGSLHERNRSKRRNRPQRDFSLDESSPERGVLHKKSSLHSPDRGKRTKTLEPSPDLEQPPTNPEQRLYNSPGDADGNTQRLISPQESKIRNIFKGGRIAEIVGNEVSRVGDKIRRKDGLSHSRQSSYAPSLASEYHESDDDRQDIGQQNLQKPPLSRLTTATSDDFSLLSPSDGERGAKTFVPNLPNFTSTLRQQESTDASNLGGASSIKDSQGRTSLDNSRLSLDGNARWTDRHDLSGKAPSSPSAAGSYSDRRDSYEFGPTLETSVAQNRVKRSRLQDDMSASDRPPVTGLRNVDATAYSKRPSLADVRDNWTISDRSIPTLEDHDLGEKREILRVRALLFSSGIKAHEICRRAETPRNPPAFVRRSLTESDQKPPPLRYLEAFDYTARSLIRRFENDASNLQQAMDQMKFSTSPLLQELANLENLVNDSLTPRVRAAALEAENLSTQLNTTSTLTIKQLSDALVQGIRKRNRRLRLIRRVGFVLLEWTVVGVMWWVWLLVMVFKIFRGILRGTVTAVRWILWI